MNASGAKMAAELVGAGAVLMGLIFVGLELRQNTAAVQAATFQEYTNGTIDWMSEVAADRELSEIWRTFITQSRELDEIEQMRATFLARMQWFRYQAAYSQRERGSLSETDWEVSRRQICRDPEDPNDCEADVTNSSLQDRA